MLMSALRRLEIATAVYVVAEDQSTANNAVSGGAGAPYTPRAGSQED